ncbi:hypothetical protein TFLX_01163 [Thermoflexales bacterium]|nr:hypothetical protein TFLX_01163 [Thermoflexales bacterium]
MSRRRTLHVLVCLTVVGALIGGVLPVSKPILNSDPTGPAQPDRTQLIDPARLAASPARPAPITASNPQPVSQVAPHLAAPDLTFVRDVDLGDGRREAIVSDSPLSFRAADGTWQPIDARFAPVESGFANISNTLEIRAAASRASLNLTRDTALIGWEPLALVQTSSDTNNPELTLAQPLTTTHLAKGTLSNDGHTITYANSWTAPGLSDEIVADAGAVEHNLIVAQRPSVSSFSRQPEEGQLVLRALLHLPNAALFADGAPQSTAFETDDELQVRDIESNRLLLTLAPSKVYERVHPAEGIAARYHVIPYDVHSWLIEMSTPLAWWLDSQRQYPIVWDPAFLTQRGNLDVAEIAGPSLGLTPIGCMSYADNAQVGLGRNGTCGERRVTVRFKNLAPSLFPPDSTVEAAWLAIGTSGGQVSSNPEWRRSGWFYANVFNVISNWSGTNVAWPGPGIGTTLCSPYFIGFSLAQDSDPSVCRIQDGPNGTVSDWINGSANNGLLIAMRDPNCLPSYTGCDFALIPRTSSIGRKSNGDLSGAGFALVIQYRGPVLPANEPFGYEPPALQPPATAPGPTYLESEHDYRLPLDAGSPWTAVAVKGFTDQIVFANELKDGLFSYSLWAQAGALPAKVPTGSSTLTSQPDPFAFALPISACHGTSCSVTSPGNGTADGSNFVMLRGNTTGRSMRIGMTKPAPALKQYVVETAQSIPITLPPMDPTAGVKYTETFTISTRHVITAFHVSLPAAVNAYIAISQSIEGLMVPSASATARLFSPTSSTAFAKAQSRDIASGAHAIETFIATAGDYGLAVELPGDTTAFDRCLQECPPDADVTPAERTLAVSLLFQLCPANSEPTTTGCSKVKKPDWTETSNWITVANFRVYSPDGFDCNETNPDLARCKQRPPAVPCYDQYCARRYGSDGNEYTTMITWLDDVTRLVGVVGKGNEPYPVWVNTAQQGQYLAGSGKWFLTKSGALTDPAELWPRFKLGQDLFGLSSVPAIGSDFITVYCDALCTSFALSEADLNQNLNLGLRINMRNGGDAIQHAEYAADIKRPVQTISGPQNQQLRLGWWVKAEGYQGWPNSPDGDGPINIAVMPLNTIATVPVASLTYRPTATWTPYYNPTPGVGYFDRFRNEDGIIQQPDKLGGAWNRVDLLVLPYGEKPDGGGGPLCTLGFCSDIRAADDSWAAPKRQWRMPDININQLPPGTVILNRPGLVQVFSKDHPATQSPQDTNLGFSFKTLGANVSIKEMVCPDSANSDIVTVIQGNSNLLMPGIGASPDGAMIQASFTLCESALHEVSLSFHVPPGIPVGPPSPLWVDMISGRVTLNPDYGRIQVQVGFYIGAPPPQAPAQPFKGIGTLTIDTRGMLDIQATGRVFGIMDTDAHLWVAWNPLDLGMNASGFMPHKDNWILHGSGHIHAWVGRGWQGKYAWLPDNNEFHFAASYRAEFKLAKGKLIDEYPIVIPPGDIVLGIELAFGQFCSNDACSSYEWGIKGKLTVLGYEAGVYINLDCLRKNPAVAAGAVIFPPVILACTSFILGSDSHILIDQYRNVHALAPTDLDLKQPARATDNTTRTTAHIGGQEIQVNRRAAAQPFAANSDEALPEVTASTASFMLAFGWVRGNPQVSLVRPDNVEINVANAASYNISATVTSHQVIFGVTEPMPGVWLARLTNTSPTNDYHLAFFANKAAPQLEFTAPVATEVVTATTDGTTPDYYHITWTPPANADQLRLSLYYSATNAGTLTTTQQYGGPIVENIDPSTGDYAWNLSFLGSGEYRVYATLQDKAGAQVSVTGTNQLVGVPVSVAPGLVSYVDLMAPPPLVGPINHYGVEDGEMLCWKVSPASDLAEYRLSYVVRDSLYPAGRHFAERIRATVSYKADGSAEQCTRLSGLNPGDSQVYFNDFPSDGLAVADATGNVSTPTKPDFFLALGGLGRLTAPVLSGVVDTSDASVVLTWPITSGYRWELFYTREAFAGTVQTGTGALEGDSPIDISNLSFTGDYALHGLPSGYWYSFAVRAYTMDPNAPPSLLSNHVWLLVTDGVDANGDGCADDWEAAHSPIDLNVDLDGDGLTTGYECAIGTNPYRRDTDGDSWSDGEEVYYGTDPLDPNDHPDITNPNFTPPEPLPYLTVSPAVLNFLAFTQGSNPAAQRVDVINLGGGVLTPSVSSNAAWLNPQIVNGNVRINVDQTGMSPGNYSGTITVTAQPSLTQANPQVVQVKLKLLAGTPPIGTYNIYLPLVRR